MPYRPIEGGSSTTQHGAYRVAALVLHVILLAASSAAAQAPATAPPPPPSEETIAAALELFHQGQAEYREGRFEEASALFARAHDMYPEPVLLYNLARSEENLRHWRVAADTYRAYLAADADADDRAGIERRVTTLEEQASAEEALVVPAIVPPPPVAQDDTPWGPIVLGGIGVLGLGAGVGIGIAAQDQWSGARSQPMAQAVAVDANARDLATVANVAFAVAGAMVAAAAVWLVVELTD